MIPRIEQFLRANGAESKWGLPLYKKHFVCAVRSSIDNRYYLKYHAGRHTLVLKEGLDLETDTSCKYEFFLAAAAAADIWCGFCS